MTNTLTIPLDLAERLDSPHSSVRNAALESLRRILAAPVVEAATCAQCKASTTDICNQNGCGYLESGNGAPAVEGQADAELLVEFFEHGPMATINWFTPSSFEHGATKVYTSPPAPVAVPEGWKLVPIVPTPEMVEALKARLMVTSRGGILSAGVSLADAIAAAPACLDKVKEMNQ